MPKAVLMVVALLVTVVLVVPTVSQAKELSSTPAAAIASAA